MSLTPLIHRYLGAFLSGLLLLAMVLISFGGALGQQIIGLPLFLFLPGLLSTFLISPNVEKKMALDFIERITLSLLLSLITTSVLVFFLYWVQPLPRWFIDPDLPLPLMLFITAVLGSAVWLKHKKYCPQE